MSDGQKIIFTTNDGAEAQIVRGVLESSGIKAFVMDENLSRLNPMLTHALGGIRITVHPDDFKRAKKLLQKSLGTWDNAPFSGRLSPFSDSVSTTDTGTKQNDWQALIVILFFLACVGILVSGVPSIYRYAIDKKSQYWEGRHPHPFPQDGSFHVAPETRVGMSQPADDLLRKAQANDAEAAYLLGCKYLFGVGIPQNDQTAVAWIRKAADQGFAKAQYFVGDLYARGFIVVRDDHEAFRWFEKAANQGFSHAQGVIGSAYVRGYGVTKDYQKAVEWLRKGVSQNDRHSESELAYCYLKGLGLNQDYAQAHQLFEKAAWQGDSYAQSYLGYMYEKGEDVQQSDFQAFVWFHVAAINGNRAAQHAVGYWRGSLTPVQLDKARELGNQYQKRIQDIANGKVPSDKEKNISQTWSALPQRDRSNRLLITADDKRLFGSDNRPVSPDLTHHSARPPQNFADALKAAEQGNAEAQSILATMYYKGKGIPIDYIKAFFWSSVAANNGYYSAMSLRDAAANHLTSFQIFDTQKDISEWKPKPKTNS